MLNAFHISHTMNMQFSRNSEVSYAFIQKLFCDAAPPRPPGLKSPPAGCNTGVAEARYAFKRLNSVLDREVFHRIASTEVAAAQAELGGSESASLSSQLSSRLFFASLLKTCGAHETLTKIKSRAGQRRAGALEPHNVCFTALNVPRAP